MTIYIIQSRGTGAILSAGFVRPDRSFFAPLTKEFVKGLWVIEVPEPGDYIYHNADIFLEMIEDGV